MREIKFRAWDKVKQKMIYKPEALHKITFNETDNGFHLGKEDEQGDWHELPVMMFTGAHDKNGKPAYLGDIFIGRIKKSDDLPLTFEEGKYQIVWEDYGFVAKSLTEGVCDCWFMMFPTNIQALPLADFEIIGNEFENPELLKPTSESDNLPK